jgi:hypothetical protein
MLADPAATFDTVRQAHVRRCGDRTGIEQGVLSPASEFLFFACRDMKEALSTWTRSLYPITQFLLKNVRQIACMGKIRWRAGQDRIPPDRDAKGKMRELKRSKGEIPCSRSGGCRGFFD